MKIGRTPLETATRPGLGVSRPFRYFVLSLGGAVFSIDRTGQAALTTNLELQLGAERWGWVYD